MPADQPVVIYHNSRCSKSRQTLALLHAQGLQPQVVEYLKTPPGVDQLAQIAQQLGLEPQEFLRFGEDTAKNLGLGETDLRSRDEWLQLMHQHPVLIERPIVVHGTQARIGRPPEKVLEILG